MIGWFGDTRRQCGTIFMCVWLDHYQCHWHLIIWSLTERIGERIPFVSSIVITLVWIRTIKSNSLSKVSVGQHRAVWLRGQGRNVCWFEDGVAEVWRQKGCVGRHTVLIAYYGLVDWFGYHRTVVDRIWWPCVWVVCHSYWCYGRVGYCDWGY